MTRLQWYVLAFCILWAIPARAAAADRVQDNLAAYERTQVLWGATTLPVSADVEYQRGVKAAAAGHFKAAEGHLERAAALVPQFPDPYFTLAKIKFRRFDPDALYYFVKGVAAVWNNFHTQALLALNATVIAALALVLALCIVCLALAVRYLPFTAHKPAEALSRRLHASAPRLTALLLLSVPFALFPGFVTGILLLMPMIWPFMQRRERVLLALLVAPLAAAGFFSSSLEILSPVADPTSMTSLLEEASHSVPSARLVDGLARADVPGLEADKHNALGLLYLRGEEYEHAADHFLKAISLRPGDATAYVNLGNVYYAQGLWDKALEGYRKAAHVDSTDAVGQYNLAQGYIKTLLMAESSRALQQANMLGLDDVRRSFAEPVVPTLNVYPKTFSTRQLWHAAVLEGRAHPTHVVDHALRRALGLPLRTSAWLLLAAFAVAMIVSRALKPRHVTFQCSNCGDLMCEQCGNAKRGSFLCANCHSVIAEVSSDKVVEALLRQRRQRVVISRRRATRWATVWLPGMRDVFHGKMGRGVVLAMLFSLSAIELYARGFLVPDWHAVACPGTLWKWVLPATGVLVAYLASLTSKGYVHVRNYRSVSTRSRSNEAADAYTAQSA